MSVEYHQWDEVMKCVSVKQSACCAFQESGPGGVCSYLYDQCFFHGTDAPHSQHFQWSTTEVKPGVQVEVRNSPNTRDIYP